MKVMATHSNDWTVQEAAHLLNRAGFGGSPQEIRKFYKRGCKDAVEWLLAAQEESGVAEPKLENAASKAQREFFKKNRRRRGISPELEQERRKIQRASQKESRQGIATLTHWWVDRMCLSQAPLREKMVLFWHDHFPSSGRKVRLAPLLWKQQQLFRSEAVGSFKNLVQGIAKDPAMMLYLDSSGSRKKKPNENFARELLELFTLGEGNYDEKDVKEAARAFTGGNVNRGTGEVTFAPRRWDEGVKKVLGHEGPFKGEDVVSLALAMPACGQLIARKVWEYFCYENPSNELVERLGSLLMREDYELKPLLREIFSSTEFYSKRAMRSQIKSPLSFLVMLNRQLELGPIPGAVIAPTLGQLGQTPFEPPNVAGWDWGKSWVNTNTLLTRYHYAGIITGAGGNAEQGRPFINRRIQRELKHPDFEKIAPRELREDIPALVEGLAFRLFQTPLSEKNRTAFESYARAKKGVVFTNTEIAELLHLMMSTPTYQLT